MLTPAFLCLCCVTSPLQGMISVPDRASLSCSRLFLPAVLFFVPSGFLWIPSPLLRLAYALRVGVYVVVWVWEQGIEFFFIAVVVSLSARASLVSRNVIGRVLAGTVRHFCVLFYVDDVFVIVLIWKWSLCCRSLSTRHFLDNSAWCYMSEWKYLLEETSDLKKRGLVLVIFGIKKRWNH